MRRMSRCAHCYMQRKAYIERNGSSFRNVATKTPLVPQFYRMSCFRHRRLRAVMWDGIDCHRCRMRGWIAVSWNDRNCASCICAQG